MLTGLKDWSCGYEIESCRKKKDGKTEEDENEDEDEQVKSEERIQECPTSSFSSHELVSNAGHQQTK